MSDKENIVSNALSKNYGQNNENNENEIKIKDKEKKNVKNIKNTYHVKDTNKKHDIKEKTDNSISYFSKEIETKRSNNSKFLKQNYQNKLTNESDIPLESQSNHQKSIFTKLSEIMFDNLIKENDNNRNYYNYESLTNEHYLLNYSKKFNKENKETIKNFIERSQNYENYLKRKKDNNIKYMKLEKKNKSSSRLKSFRTIDEFLNDQKQFEENKNNTIEKLKSKQEERTNLLIRDKPLINSNSNKILQKSRNGKNEQNIYLKLYGESTYRKQNEHIKRNHTESSRRTMNNKDISKLCEKLFLDSIKRENNKKEAIKNNFKEITKQNKITSNYSNELLSNKFLNIYKKEISNIFNTNVEDDFEINFQQFILLLYNIGFINKNYSTNEKIDDNLVKEYKLLKESWKVLTRNKEFDINDNITSHKLIIFLLSTLGIYDGNNNNSILKKYSFINIEKYKIIPKLAKQIKTFFRAFTDNLINHFFQKEENPELTLYKEKKKENYTFKPKTNNKSPYNKNLHNKGRLSVEKEYNIYRLKREQNLKNEREKNLKKEIEECCFFPNQKYHKPSQTISNDVSQRLYNKKPKNYNKEKDNNENNVDDDENTFYPSLTTYNSKIFEVDPLKNDKSLKQRYNDYEQSRKDKKIKHFLKNKGNKPHKKKEDRENLIKEITDNEIYKTFRFDNEIGNYKNTFDKFNNDLNGSDKKNNRVRYVFEINIDNKVKRLILHKGDNAEKQVEKFCYENDLEPESKGQILDAIKDKFKS